MYCKAVHGFSGKRDEVSVVETSGMRHKREMQGSARQSKDSGDMGWVHKADSRLEHKRLGFKHSEDHWK